jgi:SAM-dependent methyltransferase
MSKQAFVEAQRRYYANADAAHFEWQTSGPYFSQTEAALVNSALRPGERLLEIGCGEGGNLFHLRNGQSTTLYGVDFSPAKVAFAHRVAAAHCAAADAAALPFADATFDAILIRDLLHHLPQPSLAIAEAHRVLRPGGRLTLIEPNGKSLLVFLQATLIEAERGLYRSNAKRLKRQLEEAGFVVDRAEALQPFPVARVILHPRMGLPKLGSSKAVASALSIVDRIAGRLLPRSGWTYLIFEASVDKGHEVRCEVGANRVRKAYHESCGS